MNENQKREARIKAAMENGPVTHTPLPWGMAGDSIIAGDFRIGSINHKPTEAESNANAAFVILAINTHADLVTALRLVLASVCVAHGLPPHVDAQARAALDKAEGRV